MKKTIITFLFSLIFGGTGFADNYYFKSCKLSNTVTGDYIINIEKNLIEVNLQSQDGQVQNYADKIKVIEKNKIISEKIKSNVGDNIYYQYFLNSKNKTVLRLQYKKEIAMETNVFRLHTSTKSTCAEVKADWNKKKLDEAKISKEQKQVLKAQEQIREEQDSLIDCQGNKYDQWTNCKGLYKTETGRVYDGLFVDGKILKGISIYAGGAKYFGDFKNFEPHGYGRFVWKNGDIYYGQWLDGKANGNGSKVWNDGRKYSGKFKKDKLHGKGILTYPDGKKYEGSFINNKRHGEGTFTYADGTAFIGNFLAGKQDGLGECISADGSSIPCKSKNDTQAASFSGKDTHNISIEAKKWVRISQYETNSKKGKKIIDKLENDFKVKALELCSTKTNYNILDKKVKILEVDDTPAYGLESKVKVGISGVIECV
jgi:hypothetical protein